MTRELPSNLKSFSVLHVKWIAVIVNSYDGEFQSERAGVGASRELSFFGGEPENQGQIGGHANQPTDMLDLTLRWFLAGAEKCSKSCAQ
jgi:hypothetical protein